MKKLNNKKQHPVSGKPIPPFSYRTEPNYFNVFIGPVSRDELDKKFPNGEGRLRMAIQEAFYASFGPEEVCSSGWGCTPQQKEEASYALYDDEVKKMLIKSYYNEGKPIPRALRAWELYFKEEERNKKKPVSNKIDRIIKSRERIWKRAAKAGHKI